MNNNRFTRLLEAAVLDAPPAGGAAAPAAVPVVPATPAAPVVPTSVLDGAKPLTDGDWLKSLPAEMQGDASLAKFKDIPSLAKSYIEAQKLIGVDKIAAPNAKWTDADYANFYAKLGRPETADKYTLPKDVTLPAGLAIDPVAMKAFNEAAHKAGFTSKQYEAALGVYMKDMGTRYEGQLASMTAAKQATEITLKTEWGNQYEQNLSMASQAIAQLGGEGVMKALAGNPIANNADFIKMLHKLATLTQEDSSTGRGPLVSLTGPAQAVAKINEMKADPVFQKTLLDPRAVGHKEAKAKWREMFGLAYPGNQPSD